MSEQRYVKQVIRYIANGIPQGDADSVEAVDLYLSEWYQKGYSLHSTHFIGQTVEGYGVLYILHRVK